MIKTFFKLIFYSSIIILIASFFEKDKIPDKINPPEDIFTQPLQIETNAPSFEVENNSITYIIKPLYDYDLYGMVVSEHSSSEWFDYYHDKWEDYLNLKDLCVIWGDNIKNESYRYFNFKSGSWTCYANSKPDAKQSEWSQFKFNQMSNNHLLSDNETINKKISSVKKGDLIHFKGYLVEYSIKNGTFKRGTSITRDDQGNGACETVFISNFEIIKKANPMWHELFSLSQHLAILSFLILTAIHFSGPGSRH